MLTEHSTSTTTPINNNQRNFLLLNCFVFLLFALLVFLFIRSVCSPHFPSIPIQLCDAWPSARLHRSPSLAPPYLFRINLLCCARTLIYEIEFHLFAGIQIVNRMGSLFRLAICRGAGVWSAERALHWSINYKSNKGQCIALRFRSVRQKRGKSAILPLCSVWINIFSCYSESVGIRRVYFRSICSFCMIGGQTKQSPNTSSDF